MDTFTPETIKSGERIALGKFAISADISAVGFGARAIFNETS
jgi:hypothetical protein